tara:strand:- start:238 stop:357 length:120 start_codon:yes stop_codon:yes gene_type:complete
MVLKEKGKGNEPLQSLQTLWEREKEVRGKTLHLERERVM